jgi:hypothetical protein
VQRLKDEERERRTRTSMSGSVGLLGRRELGYNLRWVLERTKKGEKNLGCERRVSELGSEDSVRPFPTFPRVKRQTLISSSFLNNS